MELLKYVLPNEVVSKVRLYHSHPVADIVREEVKAYVNDSDCKRFKRKVGREMSFHEYVFQTGWENAVSQLDDRATKYLRLRQQEEWYEELLAEGIIQ